MILILGGTTEGRAAIEVLEEAGKTFYYSTKGNEQNVDLHYGVPLQGAMDAAALETFCREQAIELLIDAAHPFAQQLHQTVVEVAERLHLPAIRWERIFPACHSAAVVWCNDYDDAIGKITADSVTSLLALTGVQSIAKLKPLWQDNNCCYFRILHRDSSRRLALQQGFPLPRLYYYHPGEDERILMSNLHPEAILMKESGTSGGFVEKVVAAQELSIRVYVIRRPATHPLYRTVNGKHGLRRMIEKYLPHFYSLHSGITTGTCATAATVAALGGLVNSFKGSEHRPDEASVVLPNGETIVVPIEDVELHSSPSPSKAEGTFSASASVVKDAGHDPDVTHGMRIWAHINLTFRKNHLHAEDPASANECTLVLSGGEGVGIVTQPGLGLEVGASAINLAPRKMIEENVGRLLESAHLSSSIESIAITISVPGGEEMAQRTFNPRLGVKGGISIIGTSGIVKPFSSEAFVATIRKTMEVAQATHAPRVVVSSGAKSERYIKAYYPDLPPQAFVHYGNFIGVTLQIANELQLPRITLGVMIGKAVKLAEGHLDTHSKKVTVSNDFIAQIARQSGCNDETVANVGRMNMARELWNIVPADKIEQFTQLLIAHCRQHCAPLMKHGELSILLIAENGRIYV